MAKVTFEQRLYHRYLKDYSQALKDFFCKMVLEILSDNIDHMKDFIVAAMRKKNPSIPSILRVDSIYQNTSKNIREKANKIVNQKEVHQDEIVQQLLSLVLSGLDDEQQKSLLKEIISDRADLAASCKYVGQYQDLPDYYEKALQQHTSQNLKDVKKIANKVGVIRNKYLGHESEFSVSSINNHECKESIRVIYNAGYAFDKCKTKEVLDARQKLYHEYHRLTNILCNKPISKKELENSINNFSIDNFLALRISDTYDRSEEILYSCTIDQVRTEYIAYSRPIIKAHTILLQQEGGIEIAVDNDLINSNASHISMETSNTRNNGYGLDDGNNEIASNTCTCLTSDADTAQARQPIRRLFPHMCNYQKGFLSPEQLDELVKNNVVFADASFWLSPDNRRFLAYDLSKMLSKYEKKLLIDWNTRVELFKSEKNLDGITSEVDRINAKDAHTVMHFMVSHGKSAYLSATGSMCNSENGIIKIAKENPNVMFTVFSMCSDRFLDRIEFEKIDNLIPVSLLGVIKRCIVRERAQGIVKGIFSEISTSNKSAVDFENNVITNTSEYATNITELSILADTKDHDEKESNKTIELESSATTGQKDNAYGHKIRDNDSGRTPVISNKRRRIGEVRLVKDTNELIPVDIIPTTNDVVFDSDGKRIVLGSQLGCGGEGTIFRCDYKGKVVKIYQKNKLTVTRMNKLNLMIQKKPNIRKLCWPEDLIFNEKNQFIGYIMKSAEGYKEFGLTVLKLNSDTVAEKTMKGWDRKALVELCYDLCKTFNELHKNGILMGDVNPRNMLLNTSNPNNHLDYVMVDCDSYQIEGYPCPVGTVVFTSPKIYERNNVETTNLDFSCFLRTIEDENYSIASLLFHILMLNQSPFAKKNGEENILDAIRKYDFAYILKGNQDNTGADVPDGPFRMIWNNMPNDIKQGFGDVFKFGNNVEIDWWINKLYKYLKQIEKGIYTDKLKPVLYLDINGDFTTLFKCDMCGEERNMPKEKYEKLEQRKQPHLCNKCLTIKKTAEEDKVQHKCRKCGRSYTTNRWDEWLINNWYGDESRFICHNCKYNTRRGFSQRR